MNKKSELLQTLITLDEDYRQRSRTPLSESFLYVEDYRHEC